MKRELLFVAGTHGDEGFGIKVLKEVAEEIGAGKFDWMIGNERAVKLNKRFIKFDLNRQAPGDPEAEEYEKRRPFEIIKKAKDYKLVIDLHGTVANSGIFVIVSNPKIENLALTASMPVKNIVIWVAKKTEIINPLGEFFPAGFDIECGPKKSRQVKEELKLIIKTLAKGIKIDLSNINNKKFFQVYGRLDGEWKSNLLDFKVTTIKSEKFYPILASQYPGITCYKMKEINFIDLFAY